MDTSTTALTFGVWRTFRTGLQVARRKALIIIIAALVARFIASQVVSSINTVASTSFGLDLVAVEGVLVFFGSLLLMWIAVVPVTIQAIETPLRPEMSRAAVERMWRDVSLNFRGISLRTFLRSLGFVLVSYTVLAAALSSSALPMLAISSADAEHETFTWAVLGVLGLCIGLSLAVVSLRWSVALPAMIMENLTVRESLGRSWHMTRSQVLRLFGLGLLTTAAIMPLSALLGIAIDMAFYLVSDTPDYGSSIRFALGVSIGQTVGLALGIPIMSACYYYLREH